MPVANSSCQVHTIERTRECTTVGFATAEPGKHPEPEPVDRCQVSSPMRPLQMYKDAGSPEAAAQISPQTGPSDERAACPVIWPHRLDVSEN